MLEALNSHDGIELVKSETFWPEGRWSIRRGKSGEFVWTRTHGWKAYYEADRNDSNFNNADTAVKAWREKNANR